MCGGGGCCRFNSLHGLCKHYERRRRAFIGNQLCKAHSIARTPPSPPQALSDPSVPAWRCRTHHTVISSPLPSDDRLGMLRSALWYRTLSSVMTDWACCGAHCDIAHCPQRWQTGGHVAERTVISRTVLNDDRLGMSCDISCPPSSLVVTD